MSVPLSEQLRPKDLSDFFGQRELLHEESLFSSLLRTARPLSLLFWGPPGCGKTTLAKIYIKTFPAHTLFFHPASHSLADLKRWVQDIQAKPLFHPLNILFIDEIHRLNKGQQDALLPFLEEGTFTLVGATTENPSFSLTQALLSRIRVLPLKALDLSALHGILEKALIHKGLSLAEEAKKFLTEEAKGDARHLLNCVENLLSADKEKVLSLEECTKLLYKRPARYDRQGEEHYNLISALHKAIRGSDPDAALYWLSRMLQGGEDPNYLARRLVRIATEDIGLSDPQALQVTLSAWQTYERLGSPEGELALAQAAVFLALSPKSNALYKALGKARELAESTSHLSPPSHILNAPTSLMKELGYGKNYQYDHDVEGRFSGQNYFPEDMERPSLYEPIEIGFERELKKRRDFFSKKRKEKE